MDQLDDLFLFVDIVEAGSIAAAARRREMPKSTLSRRLAALEASLAQRLLQRNTRKLVLTDAGRRLHAQAQPLVEQARALRRQWSNVSLEPAGRLRVTATAAFGLRYVVPLLAEFLERHAAVRGELLLLDRPVDLIGEGFDLAIRMGRLDDSSTLHHTLASIDRVICASARYLEKVGPVATLDDLARCERVTTVGGNPWVFRDAPVAPPASASRFVTNQLDAVLAAVRLGCGVGLLPRFLVTDDLAAGRLVELVPDHPPEPGAAHALWPTNRQLAPQTRLFIDLAVERLGADATLDPAAHRRRSRPVAARRR